MTPTTIAYVMTHYPRITQTFIASEIDGLRAAGHTVIPIAINPPSGVDADDPESVDTFYLKRESKMRVLRVLVAAFASHPQAFLRILGRAIRAGGTDLARQSKRLFHFAEAVLIWRHASDRGAQHLHAHFGLTPSTLGMWACEFGRLAGRGPRTWSFTVHSASEMHDTAWALNNDKAASADAVICVSDATRSHVMRTSDCRYWSKLRTVRCGIDLDEFAYRDPPPMASPPVITMVGRLAPEKGHLVLIEAMALLAAEGLPLRARIIGAGSFGAEISAAVTEAGLDHAVDLVGELAPAAVRPAVEASDVFCLPSFDEGLPVAIMEAMAIGVPVVTTYIAGIPELAVNEETAMVVPSGNSEALARAIRMLVSDTDLRKRIAVAARRAVEANHDERATIPAFERAILG